MTFVEDDAIFRVGRVSGVRGRTVSIRVDRAKNGSHLLYRGKLLRNVSVGGYIKICKGFVDIIAKVDGEVVTEVSASAYANRGDHVDRVLTVSLIGYLNSGAFQRGIREMPLVDNACFILTEGEFDLVHNFVGRGDRAMTVGHIATEPSQLVRVGINNLFASHIGIFGNTGSGKSYTLAKLYYELFQVFGQTAGFRGNARVLLIDFNGEYVDSAGSGRGSNVIATADSKRQLLLSTRVPEGLDKLPIPTPLMHEPDFWTVLLDATEKTQAPFIRRALTSTYWAEALQDPVQLADRLGRLFQTALVGSEISAKNNLIRLLQELSACMPVDQQAAAAYIVELSNNLQWHSVSKVFQYKVAGQTYWGNQHTEEIEATTQQRIASLTLDPHALGDIDRVRLKIVLQYYDDIFRGFANSEHLGPVIKRLETRMPMFKRVLVAAEEGAQLLASPLTVVSLRDVNLEMKKVLPLLLCRYLYDEHKRSEGAARYLNIVIDEAHNILSSSSSRESEAWKDYRLETFEEIIKEGRKFGVFLTLASQRPHDISETIISQLHNYFLHRLVNNLDIAAVERSVSYLDAVSFDSLPILPTGTCILSGVSSQVPLVVGVGALPEAYAPNSQTLVLSDSWGDAGEPGPAPFTTPGATGENDD